jgi:threonine aldolase
MKEHVCTSACTANGHMYACGEKGHTCTAECKKMK